jgi:hypothetical protein
MRSSHSLDRLDVVFDGTQLVADAGLLLPATLAQHLGVRAIVEECIDLGSARGAPNPGDKLMTLVASALAGGDCIDDTAALLSGGTNRVLGFTVKAASTLGTFLRCFRWGQVRQLDRVSQEVLARAWATGAGPGAAPFTIDLDSTICETYGLAKEGALHHGYTHARGYRRPDGAPAGGSGRHGPGRGPLPARDRRTGLICGSRRRTHDARRQRLLCPRRGGHLPEDGRPPFHHRPVPRPQIAEPDRGDPRAP